MQGAGWESLLAARVVGVRVMDCLGLGSGGGIMGKSEKATALL